MPACGKRVPVGGWIERLDEPGAGVGEFGDEFENGFVGEGGLLGFAEPGFIEGMKALKILGRERQLDERRGVEQERSASGVVERTGDAEAG